MAHSHGCTALAFSYTQQQLFLCVCEGGGRACVGKAADGSKGGVRGHVSLTLISWALCPGMWEAELLAEKHLL